MFEKLSCKEVYLSTPPVGDSRSLSTVNATNCYKEKINHNTYELISNSIQTCPTTSMCLKSDAIDCIDLDQYVLQLVHLNRGVCNRSFIQATDRISDRNFMKPIFPASFKIKYQSTVNCKIQNLENRHPSMYSMWLSICTWKLPCLHYMVWDRKKSTNLNLRNLFWITYPKCVRKNTQFIDSEQEHILNIELMMLFRTTRKTPHYPIRGSHLSNFFCWMGCRRYSATNRHKMLLSDNDFRSFSQTV